MKRGVKADVAIIGAGPIGLIVAKEVAKVGAKVVVFEEHDEVGLPSHCAGLVSPTGIRKLGLDLHRSIILNKVRGAWFHSPSGLKFSVKARGVKSFVIDREAFDKFLAHKASDMGAKIFLSSRVTELLHANRCVKGIEVNGERVRSKITIDCEGSYPKFTKEVGLAAPREVLSAVQFEVQSDGEFDADYVEVFVGSEMAPGFFAYVVPLDSSLARIGLACKSGSPRKLLENFVKKRVKKYRVRRIQGGRIITSGPIPKTYAGCFLAVGDVAGQTKPTTGGGVITGGICAKIAGQVAVEAIAHGDSSEKLLKRYQIFWKKELGKEFRVMGLARATLNRLPDKTIDRIFQVIIDNELQHLIEEKGDVDSQSGVLLALIKNPIVIRAVPSILKSMASRL